MTYDITVGRRHELARERVKALALWPTHTPRTSDVLAAIDIAESARVSFWDAMILRSAVELGRKTLWTEDLNAGQVIYGARIANTFRSHRKRREPAAPASGASIRGVPGRRSGLSTSDRMRTERLGI